ncbi:hypothetical protein PSV08DRAFT_250683 [Bipolaris maydis]|uniref:uncharacterized protein n=1 Tax=Cochliobolus heterostrophus TaxID=5016 RepID=UPI0024CE23E7|nr:hypothetical protein PSV08DRAFT_250649 [Bipolaris maydis]KAJ6267550.1 hypothetical protein PSV08DRAFT_250683 [Bipolaris maydis]
MAIATATDTPRLLSIRITHAKRPLPTIGICCALAVEPEEVELDLKNILDAEDLISVCARRVVDQESAVIRLGMGSSATMPRDFSSSVVNSRTSCQQSYPKSRSKLDSCPETSSSSLDYGRTVSFKKSAWVSARAAVQCQLNSGYSKTLYNQIGTFKKDWKHWDALLSQSSFTFDQTGHPFAAKFRYQLLRAADTLRQLFSGYPATGSFVVTPEELVAGLVAGLATAEPAGETHRRRSSSSSVVVVVGPRSTAAAEKTEMRRDWVKQTLRRARQDILDPRTLSVEDFAVELARL